MAIIPTPVTTPAAAPTMTLQALAQRQRDLMQQQQGIMQQPAGTIAQGLGVLGQSLVNALQQRAIYGQQQAGRQAVSDAFSQANPQTGELPAAALGTIIANAPEMGLPIYEQAMGARAAAARQAEGERAASALSAQGASQQEAAAVAAEQRRLAEPQTPRARVLADFNSGKYGDPSTPEAQAARDAAIRASEAPELTLADRAELERQKNDYIKTGTSLNAMTGAQKLLESGINEGYLGALRSGAAKLGMFTDEQSQRTEQFKAIMEQQAGALVDTLSRIAGPAEAQSFITTMNGPADVETKKQVLKDTIAKVKAFNDSQRSAIRQIDPNALPDIPAETTVALDQPIDPPVGPDGNIDASKLVPNQVYRFKGNTKGKWTGNGWLPQ